MLSTPVLLCYIIFNQGTARLGTTPIPSTLSLEMEQCMTICSKQNRFCNKKANVWPVHWLHKFWMWKVPFLYRQKEKWRHERLKKGCIYRQCTRGQATATSSNSVSSQEQITTPSPSHPKASEGTYRQPPLISWQHKYSMHTTIQAQQHCLLR